MYNVIVVGGGVAGILAATTAASRGARVVLLESMEKPLRKLRITGKGRCNITNTRPKDEFFTKIRSGAEFVDHAFSEFDNVATMAFLERIGLELVTERGDRVFPASGKAWDVASVLIARAVANGVEIRSHSRVQSLIIRGQSIHGVVVQQEGGRPQEIWAANVILATGGVSYPATGSTGDGHQMAYDAGLEIEPLRPALVPLMVDARGLSGLTLKNISLRLMVGDQLAEERFGDVEFTAEDVISGPVVLQASRTAVDALTDECLVSLEIDLKPALSVAKLTGRIEREREALGDRATLKLLLTKLLPSQLHSRVARQSGLTLSMPFERLDSEKSLALISALKGLRFEVYDYRPFSEAIITAGGVALGEIDPLTMESYKTKGLYVVGELLDIDADTGGYNIQLAISTGHLAGCSAAAAVADAMKSDKESKDDSQGKG